MSRGATGNAECADFFKDTKPYVAKLAELTQQLEQSLEELAEQRMKHPIQSGYQSGVKNVDLLAIVKKLEELVAEGKPYQERFVKIGKNEMGCSATMFFKARHNMALMEKKRLSLYYMLSKFLSGQLTLFARQDLSKHKTEVVNLLAMVDTYNCLLTADPSIPSMGHPASGAAVQSVLHNNRHYHTHIHENFCTPVNHQLKVLTTSKLLGMVARERAKSTAPVLAKSLIEDIDRTQLEFLTADVPWMVTPVPFLGIQAEISGSAYMPGKGKDGDGSQSKKSPGSGEGAKPTVFQADTKSHFTAVERLIEDESVLLHHLLAMVPKVPGLVSPGMLKEGKDGGQRLIGTMRKKMGEYYHDILWRTTGQLVEEPLLWQGGPGRVPLGLAHPRLPLVLSNQLKEFVAAGLGDSYPSLVLPSVHIVIETLNLHIISASWDMQMLKSLAASTRAKTQRIVLEDGEHCSVTGKLFNETVNSLVHLNNRCLPDVLNDIVSHGVHDPEEFPFLEEMHILRRLQATLYAVTNWVESKSAANVQAWNVADFFIINHGDLAKLAPTFDLLQICNHANVAATNTISIKLFTHVQSALTEQVQTCQAKIRKLPTEQNENLCRICRTFSLACLQNVFPGGKHWAKSGSDPVTHSQYVKDYTERILLPVFMALSVFPTPTQQVVGRLAVKTLCDSWLEHIYQKKIRFSEGGAKRLAADFAFFRQWVDSSPHLTDEAKRYLLLLDSIRQCEGVAKLLQNSSGKEVTVKPAKTNKVTPGELPQEDNSPVAQILEAIPPELYVTNHKKWLSLRVGGGGGGGMGLPFCC